MGFGNRVERDLQVHKADGLGQLATHAAQSGLPRTSQDVALAVRIADIARTPQIKKAALKSG